MKETDLHWAAGFLDGEGYFAKPAFGSGRSARINAVQKDDWPLLKLQAILGGTLNRYQNHQKGRTFEGTWYWRWEIYGDRAVDVMRELLPLLSPRRQLRIATIIENWEIRKVRSRRMRGVGLLNSQKTHCKRGHEFTSENTYAKDGKNRQCRTCQRVAALRWYHANKPGLGSINQ